MLVLPTFSAPLAQHTRRCVEGERPRTDFAFTRLRSSEVIAIGVPADAPSRRVMQRLGMALDPNADVDHPRIEAGHPLQRPVTYRCTRAGQARRVRLATWHRRAPRQCARCPEPEDLP